MFDLSLLFSQNGITKHSGTATWLLAFAYICGLIDKARSANQNAQYSKDAPILKQLLSGKSITQSAFSRFLSKPFMWLKFSLGRLSRLQERVESRLTDGDVVALDDTKIEHPFGKMLPFLCWLFDSSDKRHVWCMNLVSTIAVLKSGLEYPMLWLLGQIEVFYRTVKQDLKAPTLSEMVRCFFNASCRISCFDRKSKSILT